MATPIDEKQQYEINKKLLEDVCNEEVEGKEKNIALLCKRKDRNSFLVKRRHKAQPH